MDPLILEIIVGVFILASFGLAYMASKTWRVTHVLLLSLVFLTGVVFWYMAARTLKIHAEWRKVVNDQTATIKNLKAEHLAYREGSPSAEDEPSKRSLRQLQYELADLVSARGQVWRDATDPVVDAQSGQITVTMPAKDHGLSAKTIVYLFEGATSAEGGDYLGEFHVVRTPDDTKVSLEPHLPLTADQLARLGEAKAPISIYTTMPTDDPLMLATLDAQRQQAIIPDQETREAFAAADRPLRDYNALFHGFHAQREILTDEKQKAESDIARLTAATKRVQTDIDYRTGERARLQEDLAGFQREVQVVTTFLEQLQAEAKRIGSALATSKANNAQLAAAVTALQLENARAVNAQTADEAE